MCDVRLGSEIPRLESLGLDLLTTTVFQRRLSVARPFLCAATFALAAWAEAWWLTPFLVFLTFVAVVTVTHDLVHEAMGLNRCQTDWALFVMGAVLLESGHAYRVTHHQHHRVFPGPDDPEGDPARMSFWKAVLHGPIFLPLLWLWAFRHPRTSTRDRCWLIVESGWLFLFVGSGIVLWRTIPGILVYAGLATVGSWVYPLLTVHLPHRNYGDTPLTQTHTLRGRILPILFLELTYHLEHHLYPQVPSHNLAKLSQRLDPFFRQMGVRPRRVP